MFQPYKNNFIHNYDEDVVIDGKINVFGQTIYQFLQSLLAPISNNHFFAVQVKS